MDELAEVINHSEQRSRRLHKSVLAAALIKPLGLLGPLVTMPLLLRYLGKEGFGLFQAVVGVAVLLSLSNAGLQQGLVNRLIDCHVSGDKVLARRYVSTLFFLLAGLAAGVMVLWTLASIFLPWGRIFKVADPQMAFATPWAAWITGVMILLSLVLIVPSAVYVAYQEMATAYFWDGVSKVATLLACLGVVFAPLANPGHRLIAVALATAGAPAVVQLINSLVLHAQRAWLRPRWQDFDLSIVRRVLGDGFSMFLLQMAVVIMFACDDALIGALVSPAAVTPYALTGQLFVMAYGVLLVFTGPLGPAYGEAYRRGDLAWIHKHLRLSLAAGFLVIGGFGVALLMFHKFVFWHWAHIEVSPGLILAMIAAFLLRMWLETRAAVLNPVGVFKPQLKFFVAHITLNLVLALALVKRFDVVGVAWAMPISGLLTTAWGYPMMLGRVLKEREERTED